MSLDSGTLALRVRPAWEEGGFPKVELGDGLGAGGGRPVGGGGVRE